MGNMLNQNSKLKYILWRVHFLPDWNELVSNAHSRKAMLSEWAGRKLFPPSHEAFSNGRNASL